MLKGAARDFLLPGRIGRGIARTCEESALQERLEELVRQENSDEQRPREDGSGAIIDDAREIADYTRMMRAIGEAADYVTAAGLLIGIHELLQQNYSTGAMITGMGLIGRGVFSLMANAYHRMPLED